MKVLQWRRRIIVFVSIRVSRTFRESLLESMAKSLHESSGNNQQLSIEHLTLLFPAWSIASDQGHHHLLDPSPYLTRYGAWASDSWVKSNSEEPVTCDHRRWMLRWNDARSSRMIGGLATSEYSSTLALESILLTAKNCCPFFSTIVIIEAYCETLRTVIVEPKTAMSWAGPYDSTGLH